MARAKHDPEANPAEQPLNATQTSRATRRAWLKQLLGGASSLVAAPLLSQAIAPAAVPKSWEESPLYSGYIAGYQYHKGPALEAQFRAGQQLVLLHEAENPHDPNALALHWPEGSERHHLGYIPRRHNRVLTNLVRARQPLLVRIVEIDPEAVSWERVRIEVRLKHRPSQD